MLNSTILLAVATLVCLGRAAHNPVVNSLLEEAREQGYQSNTHRSLGEGFCGLYCQMKRAAKATYRGINATGEALDDVTELAIDAVAEGATAAGTAALELIDAAEEAGSNIADAIGEVYDELKVEFAAWNADRKLDAAEDWLWPKHAPTNSRFRYNNHNGKWSLILGYRRTHCTVCIELLDAIREGLDACYEHRDANKGDCEDCDGWLVGWFDSEECTTCEGSGVVGGRVGITSAEKSKLQKLKQTVQKHVDLHRSTTPRIRRLRLNLSLDALKAIINNAQVD
jgi:hypothetical protein